VGDGGGGEDAGVDQLTVTVWLPGPKVIVAWPAASCERLTVTMMTVCWPAGMVPPVPLSVTSVDVVVADQVTGPPLAVRVISPVEPVPRGRSPGET
jgi:hypothetical protein